MMYLCVDHMGHRSCRNMNKLLSWCVFGVESHHLRKYWDIWFELKKLLWKVFNSWIKSFQLLTHSSSSNCGQCHYHEQFIRAAFVPLTDLIKKSANKPVQRQTCNEWITTAETSRGQTLLNKISPETQNSISLQT